MWLPWSNGLGRWMSKQQRVEEARQESRSPWVKNGKGEAGALTRNPNSAPARRQPPIGKAPLARVSLAADWPCTCSSAHIDWAFNHLSRLHWWWLTHCIYPVVVGPSCIDSVYLARRLLLGANSDLPFELEARRWRLHEPLVAQPTISCSSLVVHPRPHISRHRLHRHQRCSRQRRGTGSSSPQAVCYLRPYSMPQKQTFRQNCDHLHPCPPLISGGLGDVESCGSFQFPLLSRSPHPYIRTKTAWYHGGYIASNTYTFWSMPASPSLSSGQSSIHTTQARGTHPCLLRTLRHAHLHQLELSTSAGVSRASSSQIWPHAALQIRMHDSTAKTEL